MYLMALGKDATSLLPLTDRDERVLGPMLITPNVRRPIGGWTVAEMKDKH